MIKLEHISKWITIGGVRTFLLKDIGLTIKEGEFISIMGPSGSGKSTLLNIMGMLDEQSEGEYYFFDEQPKAIIKSLFTRTCCIFLP